MYLDYQETSKVLKAISDPNRMKIIDILSCGSQCACDILEHFDFTQPSLSHHMKVLEKAGIITVSKQGQWHHYELKEAFITSFMDTMMSLFSANEDSCICTTKNCSHKGEITHDKTRTI